MAHFNSGCFSVLFPPCHSEGCQSVSTKRDFRGHLTKHLDLKCVRAECGHPSFQSQLLNELKGKNLPMQVRYYLYPLLCACLLFGLIYLLLHCSVPEVL